MDKDDLGPVDPQRLHRIGERNAVPPLPCSLREELVDVGGDRLVEVELFVVQLERDRVCMPIGEQPLAGEVPEVLLEAAQSPGAIGAEPQDVPPDLASGFTQLVRLWKQVGIE